MTSGFQNYSETLRSALDRAFEERLSALLGGVPLENVSSFMETVKAGKKIRGCLSCLICESLGSTFESAVPRATAVELIQAATLIHDDFVDQDAKRKNRPAAWTLEGARRAVLIGDVIFAATIKSMTDLSMEDGSAISHAIAEVSRGALQEPLEPKLLIREIESGRFNARSYDKIIRLKTGMLFGTACLLGSIAAGADACLRKISYDFGLSIGEAYQIADDVKEIRDIMSKGSITPEQAVGVAPALLHFVEERLPDIKIFLKQGSVGLNDSTAELLSSAAGLMQNEIELRLRSAASEIDGSFPRNYHGELARRAPWDIIRMFNDD